jgi:hypothetical protein
MNDQSSLFSGLHDGTAPEPHAVADKHDCGCGCGGTGGCGESKESSVRSIRQGRRKFLVGGIGVTAFAATLSSRPAFAQSCMNLTGLYSPSGSQTQTGVCNALGKTPGFWANHAGCWPSTISPTDTFSKWFGATTFANSGETMTTALCPPNGLDNLAFQMAAALLNAEASQTNSSYGYGSAQAFANAVIAAFNALRAMQPPVGVNDAWTAIHDRIAHMNTDNSSVGAWCSQQSICH